VSLNSTPMTPSLCMVRGPREQHGPSATGSHHLTQQTSMSRAWASTPSPSRRRRRQPGRRDDERHDRRSARFRGRRLVLRPAAGKHVSRLAHRCSSPSRSSRRRAAHNSSSDRRCPGRRRPRTLSSYVAGWSSCVDMITRALVLVSRKNVPQRRRFSRDQAHPAHGAAEHHAESAPPAATPCATARRRSRSPRYVPCNPSLRHPVLSEALTNVDLFAHDQRNFGAQQAMILRDQKSWSAGHPPKNSSGPQTTPLSCVSEYRLGPRD